MLVVGPVGLQPIAVAAGMVARSCFAHLYFNTWFLLQIARLTLAAP
jgi:hypothetical protein